MKLKRILTWLVVGGAIVAAIVWGFMPRPIPVETVRVERGPLQVSIEEEGKTRVVDRFVVSAPVAGFARRLKWDVGDVVKRGQALLNLDPPRATVLDPRSRAEAEARVAAAEASLKQAQQDLEAAEAEARRWETQLKRRQELHAAGTISDEDLNEAESGAQRSRAQARAARFAVEVAQHQLEAARTALQHSAAPRSQQSAETISVRAPVGGRILKIIHESEGVVNPGDTLVEIGNSHGLEVVVELLSADAVKVAPGTSVLFERWGGERPLEGRVRVVEPTGFTKISALGVEEQRILVIVDITSPPEEWARLGDGYRVEARFILWEGENVLQVPSSTLFREGAGWGVFTLADGLALRKSVELGKRSGLIAEVLSGLQEGDMVITHPDDAIADGVQVEPRGGK
ncbi:MAG: efflux RND transporter periplasmic adaptor subunit [Acidobacteria bacterium]|nr:efflux RND transporter periplasmic adaptor subunit [Acidobacteriota bacterium]